MYKVFASKRFSKSLKKILKSRSVSRNEVQKVIELIASGERLDSKYRDHKLQGEFKEYRECHIRPDVLLIYQKQENVLILLLVDIGSHAELFE